ncbi:MAG: hypothetical protein HYV63_19260, partial [Candidatus Schekmanbacteria bacterium]|nr:hypothetical protein [Candidatus Schekmanbacteria bacterium]
MTDDGPRPRWRELVERLAACFDRLERGWDSPRASAAIGNILVVAFVAALGAIELGRRGWFPGAAHLGIPTSHFAAVQLALTLLLFVEVVGLVFALPRSVADSIGVQFELLSLILLRKAFAQVGSFGEPIRWSPDMIEPLIELLADAGGAIVVFVVLGFYTRAQRHRSITADDQERASFVLSKKLLALSLLAAMVMLGARELWQAATSQPHHGFFAAFYLLLIFSDILVVLLSYRYSHSFAVVFRNSGFTVATVLIRLALSAPAYYNVALAVGSA